jgi:hypothetical protein
MGSIELPQLGEGRFQRSPHPPERSGLLLDDLIVENVDGSAMKAKIAGHGLCIAPQGLHAQHLWACRSQLDRCPLTPQQLRKNQQDYNDIVVMGLPLSNDGKPVPAQQESLCGLIPKGAQNVAVGQGLPQIFDPAGGSEPSC